MLLAVLQASPSDKIILTDWMNLSQVFYIMLPSEFSCDAILRSKCFQPFILDQIPEKLIMLRDILN